MSDDCKQTPNRFVLRFSGVLLSVVLSIGAAVATVKYMAPVQTAPHRETSFERVTRTNTIRCGYATWYPEMIKDPNTGKLSGYDYDVVNELGKVLGLKVEWVEETGWGVAEQGLITSRYDMACNAFWGPPARAKAANYSIPYVHHPVFPVIRKNLVGPQDSIEWLNDPKYKFAVHSGAIDDAIASNHFPKAATVDVLTLGTDGDAMMSVSTGKADFTFANWTGANRFLEQNPDSIKIIPIPIEVEGGALLLPNDDPRFKFMVDKGLKYLLDSGFIRSVMTRYMGNDPRAWRHPAESYETK